MSAMAAGPVKTLGCVAVQTGLRPETIDPPARLRRGARARSVEGSVRFGPKRYIGTP